VGKNAAPDGTALVDQRTKHKRNSKHGWKANNDQCRLSFFGYAVIANLLSRPPITASSFTSSN
jgi:hypothetical protein